MGSFIQTLKNESEKIEILNASILKDINLNKLKEYQANYQMICESFSINFTEFEQIFGMLPQLNEFNLWDTDNNGLIDSLELFSGIILFADCSTDDKMKCLFELYDFNKFQSLGFFDLFFLIYSAISACFKMHKIGIFIPQDIIEEYACGNFSQSQRVKYYDLLRFVGNSPEVKEFLKIFKVNPVSITLKDKFEIGLKIQKDLYYAFKNQLIFTENANQKQILSDPSYPINNTRFEKYRSILYSSTKRLVNHRTITKPQIYKYDTVDYNLKLNWVYGVRISEVKKPVQYLNSGDYTISTGFMDKHSKDYVSLSIVLYSIGKLVVLFNINYYKQRFYMKHENEVISFVTSAQNGAYVASGELCQRPAIHVWDSENLSTLAVIKGHHLYGVHLLAFTYGDKFLLTCGRKENSPIFVYEWAKHAIVLSFLIDGIVQDLSPISFLLEDTTETDVFKSYNSIVCVCSTNEINLVQFKQDIVKNYNVSTGQDHKSSEIVCTLCIKGDPTVEKDTKELYLMSNSMKSTDFVIITGHLSGEVQLFSPKGYLRKDIN